MHINVTFKKPSAFNILQCELPENSSNKGCHLYKILCCDYCKFDIIILYHIVKSTYRWSVFRFCTHWRRRYLVPGGQLVDVHHVSRLSVHHEIPGAVKRFFALDAHQRQAAIVQVSGPFCTSRKTNINTGNAWHQYTYVQQAYSKILYNTNRKRYCNIICCYWNGVDVKYILTQTRKKIIDRFIFNVWV